MKARPNRVRPPVVEILYPEVAFGGYTRVDGTVEFYTRVQALMKEDDVVLDIGCGRGKAASEKCKMRRWLCNLGQEKRRVIGIDVDTAGVDNPLIHEFRLIEDPDRWPIDDESIDIAVANSVVEHLQNPDAFLAETQRVLRPGGHLCVRTYNTWNYVGMVARLVPNRLHDRVLAKAQQGRKEDDVFPTVYRCNTRRKLQRALENAGFESFVYTHEAEPAYLGFSRTLYRLAAYGHSLMPPPLRWALLGFARKPVQTVADTLDAELN